MRQRICLSVFILLLFGAGSLAQSGYFPPGALSEYTESDKFCARWYTEQLKALQEPSLWLLSKAQKKQSYRFLWLRTWHHPVVIRIDVQAGGTSQLTTKTASGTGGDKPGHLMQNDSSTLTMEQTKWLMGRIEENKFWNLEGVEKDKNGKDGARWIIEGVKDGHYHLVDRWSPQGGPVRAIGIFMLMDLAKLEIPFNEMY